MTDESRIPGAVDAVYSWWHAMALKDLAALRSLALDDYMSQSGPHGRELGREALLEGAADFFADASIDRWRINDIEVRLQGAAAVCCYDWSESGVHEGETFDLSGAATDVLVLQDGRWRAQAHHVSMSTSGAV